MDRSVDPCVDFFKYSCGGWIKNNPIPPDQSSWDTYSKMQDENRGRLRGILEAAAAPDPKRNAATQKIGDYYSSCMDEKAIEAKGAEPLKPGLERIAKIDSKAEIADVAAAMVHDNVLFRFDSTQDFRDANQVIAEADQGGLGLPDRDYYVKDDAKSVELRKAYVAHVQKMFELLGDQPEAAAAEAQTVMRIETALAKGSMTRVERREPKNLDHKMTSGELEKISPDFQWQVYFAKVGLPSLASLNVAAPGFFKAMNEELEQRKPGGLEDLSALAPGACRRSVSFLSASERELRFLWKDSARPAGTATALEALHGERRRRSGRSSGPGVRGEIFQPARPSSRRLKMVKEIEAAMEQDINSLPWMSAATKQQALVKLHGMANKIGYPDKWRDYSKLEIVRGDELGNVERAADIRIRPRAGQDRQARRPRRVGHDAAHRECLLRSADERHQLSGRSAAAAGVRSQFRCRAQLRRHRRHHRPRTHARLRRRRPPVRRAGQPARLVDRGRWQRVREARQLHLRPVFALTPSSTTSRSTAS